MRHGKKTKEKVEKFFKKELKIGEDLSIDRAHRMANGKKPRPIVIKLVASSCKTKIFGHVKNLAGKTQFSVSEQFPQEIQQRRNDLWPKYKEAKKDKKNDVKWNLDKLIINGQVHSSKEEKFQIDFNAEIDDINIVHTENQTIEGSTFIGHVAEVTNQSQIPNVMAALLQDKAHASASHHFYAYRIGRSGSANIKEGHRDDQEHGAGLALKKWLREQGKTDVMVIVSRWFGGKHIGPSRFDIFRRIAAEACEKLST